MSQKVKIGTVIGGRLACAKCVALDNPSFHVIGKGVNTTSTNNVRQCGRMETHVEKVMAIGAASIIQHTEIIPSQMSGETETQVLGFCETEGDCGVEGILMLMTPD